MPFLSTLFRLLDTCAVRYCVLHSWGMLPEELPSDLDIAVHPEDRQGFSAVLRELTAAGYCPVQCFNYLVDAYYFIFVWFDGTQLRSLALDTTFDHWRSGLRSLRGEEMVEGRVRLGTFWIASPEVEFTYLLAKRTWKGAASASQLSRLQFLANSLGRDAAERLAGRVFLGQARRRVVSACLAGSFDKLLPKIDVQPWLTGAARRPVDLARFLLRESLRMVRRWFEPTGLFLVILGPDGAGKTTLVERLRQELGPCFRRQRVFHWRPRVIAPRRNSGAFTTPHQKPPRGTLTSCLVLLGVALDHWLGYISAIRPFLARSGFVIFDRYYQDILVDPLRYRYGGPSWLAKALSRLIPFPDLPFLVLDAEEKTILARKREVSPQELQRQRSRYRRLTDEARQAVLIGTEDGVEATVSHVSQWVAVYLALRFRRRHARWLKGLPLQGKERSAE